MPPTAEALRTWCASVRYHLGIVSSIWMRAATTNQTYLTPISHMHTLAYIICPPFIWLTRPIPSLFFLCVCTSGGWACVILLELRTLVREHSVSEPREHLSALCFWTPFQECPRSLESNCGGIGSECSKNGPYVWHSIPYITIFFLL